MTNGERRERPRVQSANLVSYKAFDEGEVLSELGIGATQDLSLGGIKLYCNRCFPVPSELVLDLALGERIIEVKGRVVRAEEVEEGQKYLIGIRFCDLSEEAQQALSEYLAWKEGAS